MPTSAPPDTVRQTRLAVLATGAAIMAIAFPPIGLLLGIVTLVVLVVRTRRKAGVTRPTAILSVTAGVFAVVVGGLLSLVLVLLGTETATLRECLAGANTRVAEQVCQDEFMDTVQRRLPLR